MEKYNLRKQIIYATDFLRPGYHAMSDLPSETKPTYLGAETMMELLSTTSKVSRLHVLSFK
jgi:hypothetical protein